MPIILLHSSKTMKRPSGVVRGAQQPVLLKQAEELARYIKTLTVAQLQKAMQLSPAMASKTKELLQSWQPGAPTLPALDIFLGDIYSGLQVQTFSQQDRNYANDHLLILSGLYGVLKPLDEIHPYRLEMGYKLPDYPSLYAFWGSVIARQLPNDQPIINLSAVEYTKALFPHLKDATIITPKFLTISPKTGEPTFVTVHTKIARGAFARWLIQERIEDLAELKAFNDLGYRYTAAPSSPEEPVFVAKEFKGIGLSVRLS